MAEEIKLNPEASSEVIPLIGAGAPVLPAYCRFLRCKEMFIDTGHPFDLADSGSGAYWCAHTQNCLGRDGQVVGVETCVSGRSCHEPC